MTAEDLHVIVSLLYTMYIVLVPIQINKNSINNPNLLIYKACLNGISLAVLSPIYFYFPLSSHTLHVLASILASSEHKVHCPSPHPSLLQKVTFSSASSAPKLIHSLPRTTDPLSPSVDPSSQQDQQKIPPLTWNSIWCATPSQRDGDSWG